MDWTEIIGIKGMNYVIENLTPDTDYHIRVFGLDQFGKRSLPTDYLLDRTKGNTMISTLKRYVK